MEIQVSVRNLVEFILRSGNIDNRRTKSPDNAMQEGGRIHRMIQRRMGADYHAEVLLRYLVETENYTIKIEGRADGIIIQKLGDKAQIPELTETELSPAYKDCVTVTIDEIKGTYREIHRIKEAVPVHLAQAKCYAYIYGIQNGLRHIRVRLTYCNIDTEEIKYFHYEYDMEELALWFDDIMMNYRKWADFQFEWQNKRQQSIREMKFPFEYRTGQKDLVTYVYQTIYHKRKLFIEAPTGVGKTISTLFPAVKAMGEGMGQKIFYLTAKTITRTVAENALEIMREGGLKFKSVILTAKDKICFMEETECNPDYCPYAKGHFDRINDAIYDLLIHADNFTREAIEEYALKHQICPFEMCLDMSLFADAVICDYNYLFDPHVYLKRFFTEGIREDYTFLIDEAHNLVERGREMYSAVLYKEDFLRIKKRVHDHSRKLERALEKSNKQLLELKRECETYQILDSVGPLALSLLTVMGELEDFLEEQEEGELRQEVLEFYFAVRSFVSIHELVDENYVIYTQHEEDGRFRIKLYCVNPANNLQKALDQGISTVYFSATLLPIRYYRSLLSGRDDDYAIYAHTPFLPEQKAVLLGRDVSSRYTRRGPEEYAQIAGYIYEVARSHRGNYMIFFPSYRMLEDVLEIYERQYALPGIQILVQNPSMEEEEREEFLSAFEEQTGQTVLGFCVMGGIFAEGIDLVGDRLVGAVIVGTGIPQISREREILKQYYDEKGESGFDYAYRFPGMNKVLQSAGRVIRSHEDRGIILLLDERFCSPDYRSLFPREWEQYQICTRKNVGKALQIFWDER